VSIPVLHVAPIYPALHVHVYPLAELEHVPPLLHGLEEQSVTRKLKKLENVPPLLHGLEEQSVT
jgi:hypothetical protein